MYRNQRQWVVCVCVYMDVCKAEGQGWKKEGSEGRSQKRQYAC